MSNVFSVDTARIAAASGDVDRISSNIEAEVRAMMAKLNSLSDCWQGSAAGQFHSIMQEWSSTQERVRTALIQIGTTLRTAGTDYEAVEQTNRMRFTPA